MLLTMKHFTLIFCLLAGTLSSLAVPAKPTPMKFTQPDGSTVTVILRGDERHHWYQTLDGYVLVNKNHTLYYGTAGEGDEIVATPYRATEIERRGSTVTKLLSAENREVMLDKLNNQRAASPRLKSEEAMKKAALARTPRRAAGTEPPTMEDVYGKGLFAGNHYPVKGEQKGLVILVEYTDVKFTDPATTYGGNVQAYFKEMLNGDNFTAYGATGSARRWFIDNSAGQFLPTFDVYGPVELEHPMAYYGGNDIAGNDAHPELMAVEACSQLDATVDFAQYDCDGDGYIDNAYIIFAGRGEASGGTDDTVWPHSWNISYANVGTYEFDNKILDRYACSNEWEGDAPDGIGTFVHEFSHVMGLPDIYPTSYTEAFTPGSFCVMDYGNYNNDGRTPPNYGIFERNALGWMRPEQLTGETVRDYTLHPIETMEGFAILTNRADEFFLIENRQATGWDKYIPGHGMLVWHIDYNTSAWSSNTVNNDKDHQCVDIVEADDIRSKETRGADPFPGTKNVTDFTHRTLPAMKTWAGREIKVPLRNIREAGTDIVFNGGYIPVPAPGAVVAAEVVPQEISTTSFTARWSLDANSTFYLLNVYNNEHRVVWNRRDVGNTDNYVVSGLKPDNLYYFTVTPCNEDADGEPSNEVSVLTLPPTLDFLTTCALEATEVGDTYFTANWEPLDAATDYVINLSRQESTPLVEAGTDFTGGASSLPTGWRTNATGYTDDLSLCGTAAPALYFDKKGYLLTSSCPEPIKEVSFSLATVTPEAGAVLKVMGMAPGSYAWKEIETIDLATFEGKDFSSTNIPEDVTSLYLEYAAAGNTAIAIDDLCIVYGGVITSTESVEAYTDYHTGNVSSIKLTGLEPGKHYEYVVQGVNDTHHARVSETIGVTTRTTAGVDEVTADGPDADGKIEYYNLQGVRIESPRAGEIYIERRADGARKVVR